MDEQIDFVREHLDYALLQAVTALAPFRNEARFILPHPLHVFHQALREHDKTWTKESLMEILDSLRQALETRLCASLDGVFVPYPHGPREMYYSRHAAHAFKKVIFLVAPALIKTARTIAGVERQEHVPHTRADREAWHQAAGIVRSVNTIAKKKLQALRERRARMKSQSSPFGRHA